MSLIGGTYQDVNQGDTLPLRVIVRNADHVEYAWNQNGKVVSSDSIYRFVAKSTGTYPIDLSVKSDQKDTLVALAIHVYPVLPPVDSIGDIRSWTGAGPHRAALMVQWIRGTEWEAPERGNVHVLCWGYRWQADAKPTGQGMIEAVAKADKRLFVMLGRGFSDVGGNKHSIRGFGYDANGDGKFSIRHSVTGQVYTAADFKEGMLELSGNDTGDKYVSEDSADFWAGGWLENYWSYWLAQSATLPEGRSFSYSQLMADLRPLVNNSWDAWTFSSINSGHVNTYVFSEWAVAAEAVGR